MQNESERYLVVAGVALVLVGLFAAAFGTTHTTMYSTITSTSYSTETTITACMSATSVPPLPCTTRGTLVYTGTIKYLTTSTTSQIAVPFQTPSYTLN